MINTSDNLKKIEGHHKRKPKIIEFPIDDAEKSGQYNHESIEHKSPINITIALYQNGFIIKNEPFRDYGEKETKIFLEELTIGKVPTELLQKFPQGVNIDLKDKTTQKYELPPAPKHTMFPGEGIQIKLGSPKKIIENTEKAIENANNNNLIQPNESGLKTNIRVRLFNGKIIDITVNYTTKISELFAHVQKIDSSITNFQLMGGYPPKPLNDLNASIEDADLLDSTITQKLL